MMAEPDTRETESQHPNILHFEAGDVEVLEEIEHVQDVLRPDALRYFPLNQQVDDLIQHSLPDDGRSQVTPSVLRRAQKKAELARQLYERTTRRNTSGVPQAVPFRRKPLRDQSLPPWIVPIVEARDILRDVPLQSSAEFLVIPSVAHRNPGATSAAAAARSYEQKMITQFEAQRTTEQRAGMNHLSEAGTLAVYHGVRPTQTGSQREPRWEALARAKTTRLLADFRYTKSILKPDNSVALDVRTLYPHEARDIQGYMLFPVSTTDHAAPRDPAQFLQAAAADVLRDPPSSQLWFQDKPVVLSEWRDLHAVAPEVDDILAHAPKSLKEAEPYLQAFGLDLQDIPHDKLLQAFPSEPLKDIMDGGANDNKPLALKAIAPKVPKASAMPSVYTPYAPGETVFRWVLSQADAGEWIRTIKSRAFLEDASLPSMPLSLDLAYPKELPRTTLQECLAGARTYTQLLRSGVFRSSVCLPTEIVKREQELRRGKDRVRLGDAQRDLAAYQQDLEELLVHVQQAKAVPLLSTDSTVVRTAERARLTPEQLSVRAILANDEWLDEEKRTRLVELLSHLQAVERANQQYFLPHSETHLLCGHVLAQLQTQDPDSFFAQYAQVVDGRRACVLCGEEVSRSVFVDADEYDEDGFKLVRTSELADGKSEVAPVIELDTGHAALASALMPAKYPQGRILFLLLTVLGISPEPLYFKTFAGTMIAESEKAVKGSTANSALADLLRGVHGIAWFIVLLKTHMPALNPTRMLPRIPFARDGYPRDQHDTDTASGSPLVDYVLAALAFIHKTDPRNRNGASNGASNVLLNTIVERPAQMRDMLVRVLAGILPKLPSNMEFIRADDGESAQGSSAMLIPLAGSVVRPSANDSEGAGLWMLDKIFKAKGLTAPLDGTKPLQALVQEPYRTAQQILSRNERRDAVDVLASGLRLRARIIETAAKVLPQNRTHSLDLGQAAAARTEVPLADLKDLAGARSESAVDSALRALLKSHPSKDRTTIKLQRPDLEAAQRTLYEVQVVQAVIRMLARTFIGKAKHKYSDTPLADVNEIYAEVRGRENLISRVPVLEDLEGSDVILESCARVSVGLPSGIAPQLALDVCTYLLQKSVDALQAVFGRSKVSEVLTAVVASESELYRFSADKIRAKILESESRERAINTKRLGAMADSERSITRDLQELKLLPLVIAEADRRAIAGAVESDVETLALPVSDFNADEDLEDDDGAFGAGGFYGERMDLMEYDGGGSDDNDE